MLVKFEGGKKTLQRKARIIWNALATSWIGLLVGIVVIVCLRSRMQIDIWARQRWILLGMTLTFAVMPLIWWLSGATQLVAVTALSFALALFYAWMYGNAVTVHDNLVAARESCTVA